jgi:hypothetical protein
MEDIFLSYAREDREVAAQITAQLESLGWSVWWDREIPAGKTWRQLIEDALKNMRCLVVLWSNASIQSDWVREEADEGRSQVEEVRERIGIRTREQLVSPSRDQHATLDRRAISSFPWMSRSPTT